MTIVKFEGCKYLGFGDNYAAKKALIQLDELKVCWDRPVYDNDMPRLVQFCQLRGRLNSPESCLSECKKCCGDYETHTHEVEVKND